MPPPCRLRTLARTKPLSRAQQILFWSAWVAFFLTPVVANRWVFAASFAFLALVAIFQRRPVSMTIVGMIALLIGVLFVFRDYVFDKTPPVRYPPPASFPVVVVYDNHAHVALWYEVEQIQREHSDWSFRIPPEEQKAMHAAFELSETKKTALGHEMYSAGYEVSEAGEGRQRFLVEARADDDEDNNSAYVTDGGRITPESYTSTGTGPHMAEGLAACGIFAAWFAVTLAVVAYVQMRYVARARIDDQAHTTQ